MANLENPNTHVARFLYQLLETEVSGALVYDKAIDCALDDSLRDEWTKYMAQTHRHVVVARRLLEAYGLDPDAFNGPGRNVIRMHAERLIEMMDAALEDGDAEMAQLVACDCIVIAETKDHMNWQIVGEMAKHAEGALAEQLRAAYGEVEDQEDRHLYHSRGFARELMLQALGLPAVVPPPEETKDVQSAIAAVGAEKARRPSARPRQH
jgi:hypothetical protein